jgi:PAS domain S-box-containing protein
MQQTGIIPQYEKEYFCKDGSRVPVSQGGARIAGTADQQICYIVDLSETRRTQAALERIAARFARSEGRYRFLTDALPQVIMMSDAQRKLSYANKHYETYTGITSAEIATRWREAIHPEDLASIDSARARGTQYEVEYRLRRTDGVYRWHVATTYEIPSEAGGNGWLATAIDIDDPKRAEESLRFLEKAGTRLAQSLDLQTTFDTILDLIVPEFGDWAAIMLRDDDGAVCTAVARHRDFAKAHLVKELIGSNYFRADYDAGTLAVYRTGEAAFRSHIPRELLVAAVKEPFVSIIEQLGYESVLALPILSEGNVIGSISIISGDIHRRYTSADLPGLEELARRAGFAIENSRSYEREHRVAHILQAAALPQALPNVPGLRFDSYYRAGRSEALIGGDWFDAVEIVGGRVAISVGDVAGSGLHAAVQMSNMRRVIRAATRFTADPLTILDIADRTLREEYASAMVTAFVGIIDLSDRTMHFASAGHLPALLKSADGTICELAAPGLPLGCGDLGAGESRTVHLPPGVVPLIVHRRSGRMVARRPRRRIEITRELRCDNARHTRSSGTSRRRPRARWNFGTRRHCRTDGSGRLNFRTTSAPLRIGRKPAREVRPWRRSGRRASTTST